MNTNPPAPDAGAAKPRSAFSHYLPRLRREFYQADAVVFWTMPIAHRAQGWLDATFHATFRELTLHAAAREGLLCPAYCLMPDHLHFVWMGLRLDTDQRNGIKPEFRSGPYSRSGTIWRSAAFTPLQPPHVFERSASLRATDVEAA